MCAALLDERRGALRERGIVRSEMGHDRITELRIEGLRTIERARLPLAGLTVLIGENGSGKSSILEACEILRRAAGRDFMAELHAIHGGLFRLLRHGAQELRLGASVEGKGALLKYDITLAREGSSTIIAEETLTSCEEGAPPLTLIRRTRGSAEIADPSAAASTRSTARVRPDQLVLQAAAGPLSGEGAFARMIEALERIDVQIPFEVRPLWACAERAWSAPLREPQTIQPAASLSRLGANLANAFHALKEEHGEDHWQTTMGYVRLGLGDHVEMVNLRVDPGGSAIGLWLKLRNRADPMPAALLSDGELSYLAFVALCRLGRDRALLAFDEPELHLHPGLLARVVSLFEDLALEQPIVLATHSDRLLDCLRDPAQSVVVCELEEPERKTRLRRLDRAVLEDWAESYRGIGQVRSEGFLGLALGDAP